MTEIDGTAEATITRTRHERNRTRGAEANLETRRDGIERDAAASLLGRSTAARWRPSGGGGALNRTILVKARILRENPPRAYWCRNKGKETFTVLTCDCRSATDIR